MARSQGVAGLILLLSTVAVAEVSAAQLQFEVTSIKPSDPMGRGQFQVLPGGRLDFRAVTLKLLILWAYDIKAFQLSGGPAWTDSQRYDIIAKSPKDDAGSQTASGTAATEVAKSVTDPIRLRLQALLSDRFHLQLRREMKEMSSYALVVGKNGPRLKENDTPARGWMQRGIGRLKGTHVDMRFLCVHLSRLVDRTVLDETGLMGNYDFELNWVPESKPATLPESPDAQTAHSGESQAATAPPSGPSIFTALQEQLGLKLERKNGLVTFFTIDHAEKASEN